jgi:hypothetical protein
MNDIHNIIIKRILETYNALLEQEVDSEQYKLKFFELKSIFIFLFEATINISKEAKEDFLKKFEKYPNVYADVVSASDNPNCTCRSRMTDFFIKNTKDVINIFNEILELNPQEELFYKKIISNVEKILKRFRDRYKISNPEDTFFLGGKVLEFETKEDYYKIINNIIDKGQYYNGLQIIESGSTKKIYFY